MKVFIVGIKGRVAQRHVKAWQKLGVAVYGCGSSVDYRDYIKDYDIIDICTPVYLHAQMIEECVKLGKQVICEKPLATNLEDALRIVKLRGKIGIVYQFRFNPKIKKLKKELEEGKYGEIKMVTANYYRWRGEEYYKKWEWDKIKAGGGVSFNVCIHYFDLLQWLFGYPTQIQSFKTTAKDIDVDDNSVSIMRFPNGAIGSVNLSTHYNPPKHFELIVIGTKKSTTIQLRENEYHKDNFEAFIKGEGFVTPLEAIKSLQMAL